MRFLALACDYDGTLATDGRITPSTLDALSRLRQSGRNVILVTGRELDDLLRVCPEAGRFDWIVAENGAVLYCPSTRAEELLGALPPAAFLDELRRRGVRPLSVGRAIVSTTLPNDVEVLRAIRDLGLELQVIFNRDAVMVLPAGVNKATGLVRALQRLALSPHNVVGVGDAENDHAFLRLCECAVAVVNALPTLQAESDWVTAAPAGAGVEELIDRLIRDDLASLADRLTRHHILLGCDDAGRPIHLPPCGIKILLAGSSGAGKSTLTTGWLERLAQQGYQFCVIDPEGDYQELAEAVTLGTAARPPELCELLQLMEDASKNVVVSLIGVPLADRPAFFQQLLPALQQLRARTGRPHWLVIDEAHHVLPGSRPPSSLPLPDTLTSVMAVTVLPDQVAASFLAKIDAVLAVGDSPSATFASFARATRRDPPAHVLTVPSGDAWLWRAGEAPIRVHSAPSYTERRRHRRKYAEGDVGPERSFYFRGPAGQLTLRAQNLMLFAQLAQGVDDETWLHHLRRHDYSAWFRNVIKNPTLADATHAVESQPKITAADSRRRILELIDREYTLPDASMLTAPDASAPRNGSAAMRQQSPERSS